MQRTLGKYASFQQFSHIPLTLLPTICCAHTEHGPKSFFLLPVVALRPALTVLLDPLDPVGDNGNAGAVFERVGGVRFSDDFNRGDSDGGGGGGGRVFFSAAVSSMAMVSGGGRGGTGGGVSLLSSFVFLPCSGAECPSKRRREMTRINKAGKARSACRSSTWLDHGEMHVPRPS